MRLKVAGWGDIVPRGEALSAAADSLIKLSVSAVTTYPLTACHKGRSQKLCWYVQHGS